MMSMLNQVAVEQLCSATYLENYLDCMEDLPDDMQRVVSRLRELDCLTTDNLREVIHNKAVYLNNEDGGQKKRSLIQIQRGLIKSQEIGDEKLSLVSNIIEHIENRTRQLEQDLENLDPGMAAPPTKDEESHKVKAVPVAPPIVKVPKVEEKPEPHQATPSSSSTIAAMPTPSSSSSSCTNVVSNPSVITTATPAPSSSHKIKRQRRQRSQMEAAAPLDQEKKDEEEKPKKKKKRKAKKEKGGDRSPVDPPIDPDEPTYCLCNQVSYGEMIGCDYDKCPIEWFHFNCVQLTHKPKGKWYCPKCRADKPTVMRPDLVEQLKKEKAKGN